MSETLTIYNKEYSFEELEQITGNKKNKKQDYNELIKLKAKQINLLLKENGIVHSSNWTHDYKVAVLLFGYKNKCNANKDKLIKEFTGFCKKSASINSKKQCNGRCAVHNGKSDNKNQNGRKKGDIKLANNTNAAVHMVASRRRQELKENIRKAYFETDLSDLEKLLIRTDEHIIMQMAIIQDANDKGIFGLDDAELIPEINRYGEEEVDDKTGKKVYTNKRQISLKDYNEALKELINLENLKAKLIELKEKIGLGESVDEEIQIVRYQRKAKGDANVTI